MLNPQPVAVQLLAFLSPVVWQLAAAGFYLQLTILSSVACIIREAARLMAALRDLPLFADVLAGRFFSQAPIACRDDPHCQSHFKTATLHPPAGAFVPKEGRQRLHDCAEHTGGLFSCIERRHSYNRCARRSFFSDPSWI